MPHDNYFKISAKGPKKGEIEIYEQIGDGFWSEGMGAKRFSKELKALGDVDQLDIRINSPGGSVFEGTAIFNQLKAHKAEKTVYIDGIAASIASVIAMAGDTVVMPANSLLMIHNPFGMVMGNADDMRKMAEALDKVKAAIITAYAGKTGMTDADISDLMDDETWMTAQEAKDWGFADQVAEPVKIAASFDLSAFKKAPKAETMAAPPPSLIEPDRASLHNEARAGGANLQSRQPQAASSPITSPSSLSLSASHASLITDHSSLSSDTPQHLVPQASVPNTTVSKEVRMPLSCKDCGTPLVDDACPRCSLDTAVKNAAKQAKEAELNRAKTLRMIGREFQVENLAEHAIEQNWTEDQLRQEILNRVKANAAGKRDPLTWVSVEPAHEGKPFRSFGEQLLAIHASRNRPDKRLMEVKAAASGASETVDADGGFLVQTDFTTALLGKANETEVLAPKCTHIPISGNRLEAPIVDESTRASGSRWGGVQVYRVAEAGTATAKKPKFAKLEMKLEKMMGIFYATEELLDDAAALEAIASRAFIEELAFKTDDEIVNGTGAGQMLGILNAACLVSQTKETGQTAATIVAENVINMYSRMPARSKGRAVWLINSECMPQIMQLNLTIGTGGVPLFMPPGGLSQAPYGTMFGKPVIEIEQCAALGTVGDIIFADLSQYAIIEKGGINADQSIHVRFLYDENCFRWTVRNNGQPIWKTALTPYKGSATVSPFVALATRA